MARNQRLTVTLARETSDILEYRARVESRTKTDVGNRLLRAAASAFGGNNMPLLAFTRQLEGKDPKQPEATLDPAELRTKSREELGRLEDLLNEIPDLLNDLSCTAVSLRKTLEAEAKAAQMAKARRLRGPAVLREVRS